MKNLYRPEIDGLRGIAVLSVVFYHFKFAVFGKELFQGGFLGVDVFFVISGYLITKIILNSLKKTNDFSFYNFYIRRARRILPMLFIILIFTFIVSYFLFLTNQFINFSYSSLSSLFFYSNYYFYNFSQGYMGNSGIDKPLLHLWSLSIEAQFYILFPIIILFIYKYFNKYLFEILLFSFFCSLIFADFSSRIDSLFTFYVLPTRAWELLAGSLCVFYERNNDFKKNNFFKSFSIIGFVLILYSFVFFKDVSRLPSFLSIPVVLGTSLIIISNFKESFINKILSTKILVALGLISYSLYLWHYPLASYYRANNNLLNLPITPVYLILISILVSTISYYFIEKPFRNKKFIINKYLIFILSLFFFGIVSINTFVIKRNGLPDRLPPFLREDISLFKPLWDSLEQNKRVCGSDYPNCIFNPSGKSGKVIILGDSQSTSLAYNLKDRLIEKDFSFYVATQKGCPYVKDFSILFNNLPLTYCNFIIQKQINDILINNPNSIVIYSATGLVSYKSKDKWISINGEKNVLTGVNNTILDLIKLGNKVIILYPLPKANVSVANELFKNHLKNKNIEINLNFNSFQKESSEVSNFLDSIVDKNIFRVYPSKIFCNEKKNECLTYDEKNIYYTDDVHLSYKGSQLVNNLIIKKILEINNIK
jgi:peptidoglycan/LPS O-acetylase OafA/YrhL